MRILVNLVPSTSHLSTVTVPGQHLDAAPCAMAPVGGKAMRLSHVVSVPQFCAAVNAMPNCGWSPSSRMHEGVRLYLYHQGQRIQPVLQMAAGDWQLAGRLAAHDGPPLLPPPPPPPVLLLLLTRDWWGGAAYRIQEPLLLTTAPLQRHSADCLEASSLAPLGRSDGSVCCLRRG